MKAVNGFEAIELHQRATSLFISAIAMSDQNDFALQSRGRTRLGGKLWSAFQMCLSFAVLITVIGLCFGFAADRLQLIESLRSVGSPSISILLTYYLIALPIMGFAGLLSLHWYRPISLALFALLTFILSSNAPCAL